jgi:CubicO group peptidase (beta-lactamase class C family)/beta-lactamase regulating signal transducer with metallopeptidase domain
MISANDLLITPIVQILGRILLHFLWQGLVVALALWLLFFVFRPSQVRYVLACAALVVMTLLPVFTGIRVAREQARLEGNRYILESLANSTAPTATPEAATLEEGVKVVSAAQVQNTNTTNTPTQPTSETTSYLQITLNIDRYLPWLVVTWFIGVVALSVRLLGGLFVTQKLRTKLTKAVPSEIEEKLESLATQLKLKGVNVLESLSVQVPMVIGWLEPVVLLPTSAISRLSVKQLEMILAHELAHIRRNDYLVNLLQTIIETLFFYHPAVWWVSNKIRETREHCCDDLAIALCGGNKFHYAQALASLDSLRPGSSLAMAANGGSLLQRIERLAGRNPQTGGVMNWLVSLILVLVPWLVLSSSYAQAKLPVEIEQNIDAFVNGRLEASGVPGIQVAVIQDGTVTFNKAYGVADIEDNTPMTVTTLMQVASVSRAVTAIAVMQLVEKGKIELDATLGTYLPWVQFKNREQTEITVRQLLAGTADVIDSVRNNGTTDLIPDVGTHGGSSEDYIRSLMPDKLATVTDFSYYNHYISINGYVLLGLMIEAVTSTSFEEYVRDSIFTPLQMTSATYDYELALEQGLTSGYLASQENKEQKVPRALWPALGLMVSSQDALKLLSMFLNDGTSQSVQILSKESLETMWTSLSDDGFAGLGFRLREIGGQRVIASIGGFDNSAAFIDFLPDANIGIITLANANINMGMSPHFQVAGSVSMALGILGEEKVFQTTYQQPNRRDISEKTLEKYTGTFSSSLGDLELKIKDGKLTGTLLNSDLNLMPTNITSSSFFIQSDLEAINGLLLTIESDVVLIEDRQFAYRVN